MRVVRATRFGGPEVLVVDTEADPVPGPGEVVVDVAVADTLFVETQIRRGEAEWFPMRPPYVPGGGVAGQVSVVGDGVDGAWIGRSVVAITGGTSGYADRAVAPLEGVVPVPDGMKLTEAAALIHDGTTALGLEAGTGINPDEWVLVTAAAGGLGILLIQLARATGAHVVAAARGARKLDLARELGADAVADYSDPGWAERVRDLTGGAGPDVVFDGAGGAIGAAAFGIVAAEGRFSAHGAPSGGFTEIDPDEAGRRGVTVRGIEQVQFAPSEVGRRAALAGRALSAAAAGRIRPVIGQTFPLERAADAHAAIEARTVLGKTLLLA